MYPVHTSNTQRLLNKIIAGQLNYMIYPYFADILLDNNIIVEYDGSGHNLKVKRKIITQREFDIKEKDRERFFLSKNMKIIRLISSTDILPNDNTILNIMEYCFFIS